MNIEQWAAVDTYADELFIGDDPLLDTVLQSIADAGLRPINVSPVQGKFLYLLAKIKNAKNILEMGTLAAYSTIWLARALPPAGRLITLESDPQCAELALANIKKAALGKAIELRLGLALDTLPQLLAEGKAPFDFIFIDADKENYDQYLSWSLKLAQPGTVIVADNVVRGGKILNPKSEDSRVQGIHRFNALLKTMHNIDAIQIQTVGSKGYDGMTIAIVT